MNAANSISTLLFRAGEHTCALNVRHVVEIMRPLPVEEVANAPGFVRGLSLIRGLPVPVVSVASLLGGQRPPTRFVVVRTGKRQVALAVDAVLGVIELDSATLSELPPLAQSTSANILEAVASLDAQLLFVWNSGTIVPDEVWQELVPAQPC
jgi:purine-binding chemotaxis protein CheW